MTPSKKYFLEAAPYLVGAVVVIVGSMYVPQSVLIVAFLAIASVALARFLISSAATPVRKVDSLPISEANPFQPALSAAGVGAWLWDYDTGQIEATDVVGKILGIEHWESRFDIDQFKDSIFRDDRAAFDMAVEGVLTGSRRSPLDCRFVRSDRSIVWVEVTMQVVESEMSGRVRVAGAMTVVTERKNVEAQLDRGSSYLEAILESTDNIVFSIDRQYRLTVFNRRFLADMRGSYGTSLHIGDNLIESSDPELVELWKPRFDSVFEGESMRVEDSFTVRGLKYFYDVSLKPIRENGYVTGAAIYSRNITRQKQREKDLQHAKEKAVESDRLKSAFLANMSHEIRTPLNAIMGFAQLLKSESVTEEENGRFLDIILSNGNHLLRILGDIIDLAQIESGQLSVEPGPCDLSLLMGETYSIFFDRIRSVADGALELVIENQLQESDYVVCDQTRLKQIIYNLVSNSIKFTLEGSIRVGYRKLDNGLIEFFVVDTGSGIPDEMKERVFSRFLQGSDEVARENDGVGLGLSICEGLVRLLGGSIWIEDNHPQGTVFKFTIKDRSDILPLPVWDPSKTDGSGPSSVVPQGKRLKILVAEDDDTNFLVIEEFLRLEKFDSIRAEDGREALKIIENDDSIGLVIMDLSMPIMDGLEATRRIKKLRPDLPVIAHTAHAMKSELDKAMAAGCSDCLVKPISIENFRSVIGRHA
ncbi:PAS domain-containing hybrid sensor histidine kinase/response regulator [Pelagicoccus albus]|uniref:histidine kinase n=1 Tax=Pelagicoccus albus TaxID=415222 RepID=A0A7X1E7M1_9BACT|nr:PAS domain-containing hybrid sensor histidine kinase/response regulator [Pelagicoccus albus]MBC2605419.1 response regulator [Pelagicoccus albus]